MASVSFITFKVLCLMVPALCESQNEANHQDESRSCSFDPMPGFRAAPVGICCFRWMGRSRGCSSLGACLRLIVLQIYTVGLESANEAIMRSCISVNGFTFLPACRGSFCPNEKNIIKPENRRFVFSENISHTL